MGAEAFRIGFAAAAALLGAACTTIDATPATFEGTEWRVTAINTHETPFSDRFRVRFKDGQFGGQMGCNNFGGGYSIEGKVLKVGPVTATEMACSDPAGMFERWGFAVLQKPMRLDWRSDSRLTLSNEVGSIALERIP